MQGRIFEVHNIPGQDVILLSFKAALAPEYFRHFSRHLGIGGLTKAIRFFQILYHLRILFPALLVIRRPQNCRWMHSGDYMRRPGVRERNPFPEDPLGRM
jgi:hypothetical protein